LIEFKIVHRRLECRLEREKAIRQCFSDGLPIAGGYFEQQDFAAGFAAGEVSWQIAAVFPQSSQVADRQPPSASQHLSASQQSVFSQQESTEQQAAAGCSTFWADPAGAMPAAMPVITTRARRIWTSFIRFWILVLFELGNHGFLRVQLRRPIDPSAFLKKNSQSSHRFALTQACA
jgi:hypothetical protein